MEEEAGWQIIFTTAIPGVQMMRSAMAGWEIRAPRLESRPVLRGGARQDTTRKLQAARCLKRDRRHHQLWPRHWTSSRQ